MSTDGNINTVAQMVQTSVAASIAKCADVVRDWESPEATFIGEELPDVF